MEDNYISQNSDILPTIDSWWSDFMHNCFDLTRESVCFGCIVFFKRLAGIIPLLCIQIQDLEKGSSTYILFIFSCTYHFSTIFFFCALAYVEWNNGGKIFKGLILGEMCLTWIFKIILLCINPFAIYYLLFDIVASYEMASIFALIFMFAIFPYSRYCSIVWKVIYSQFNQGNQYYWSILLKVKYLLILTRTSLHIPVRSGLIIIESIFLLFGIIEQKPSGGFIAFTTIYLISHAAVITISFIHHFNSNFNSLKHVILLLLFTKYSLSFVGIALWENKWTSAFFYFFLLFNLLYYACNPITSVIIISLLLFLMSITLYPMYFYKFGIQYWKESGNQEMNLWRRFVHQIKQFPSFYSLKAHSYKFGRIGASILLSTFLIIDSNSNSFSSAYYTLGFMGAIFLLLESLVLIIFWLLCSKLNNDRIPRYIVLISGNIGFILTTFECWGVYNSDWANIVGKLFFLFRFIASEILLEFSFLIGEFINLVLISLLMYSVKFCHYSKKLWRDRKYSKHQIEVKNNSLENLANRSYFFWKKFVYQIGRFPSVFLVNKWSFYKVARIDVNFILGFLLILDAKYNEFSSPAYTLETIGAIFLFIEIIAIVMIFIFLKQEQITVYLTNHHNKWTWIFLSSCNISFIFCVFGCWTTYPSCWTNILGKVLFMYRFLFSEVILGFKFIIIQTFFLSRLAVILPIKAIKNYQFSKFGGRDTSKSPISNSNYLLRGLSLLKRLMELNNSVAKSIWKQQLKYRQAAFIGYLIILSIENIILIILADVKEDLSFFYGFISLSGVELIIAFIINFRASKYRGAKPWIPYILDCLIRQTLFIYNLCTLIFLSINNDYGYKSGVFWILLLVICLQELTNWCLFWWIGTLILLSLSLFIVFVVPFFYKEYSCSHSIIQFNIPSIASPNCFQCKKSLGLSGGAYVTIKQCRHSWHFECLQKYQLKHDKCKCQNKFDNQVLKVCSHFREEERNIPRSSNAPITRANSVAERV